jgi:acyl dehydratase
MADGAKYLPKSSESGAFRSDASTSLQKPPILLLPSEIDWVPTVGIADSRSHGPAIAMSSGAGEWKLDRLGQWSEPGHLDVTRDLISAYAEATNDDHPLHSSGELAPPVFPVVGALMDVISPTMMSIAPPQFALRTVHGAHDLRLHMPIRPGMRLVYRAAVTSVHGVSSGVIVVASSVTETAAGELVAEQRATGFIRGASLETTVGEAPDDAAAAIAYGDAIATVTQTFDADQAVRYSEASGDRNPIHLDPQVAASVGLPGVIVHGLCTMAFCSRAVVATCCHEDPSRLRRLAVRFSGMVQPLESITHTLWRTPEPGITAFQSVSSSGSRAIKNGIADVLPPS